MLNDGKKLNQYFINLDCLETKNNVLFRDKNGNFQILTYVVNRYKRGCAKT